MKRHFNCKFDIDEEQEIISFYRGSNLSETAKQFHVSNGAIRNILKAYDIKIKSQSEGMRGLQNARKHYLDENFFDSIDTQEKAYILGLFCSDGCLSIRGNDIRLSFSNNDLELLEIIKRSMRTSYKIYKRKNSNNYEIQLTNKKIGLAIQKQGCVQRKSLTLSYPENIPPDLDSHFIRGMWDGDGSFLIKSQKRSRSKEYEYLYCSLCGAEPVINRIAEIIYLSTGVLGKPRKHGSIFRIQYSVGNAFLVRDYLYHNARLFLKRKFVTAYKV